MRQQVLGRGWAFSIRPLDAVHLNGSFRRVMDTHVHHGGRSLHWGAGRGGLRAVPLLEGRGAELLRGPGPRLDPTTLIARPFKHPRVARLLVPSAEICPGPRGTKKAACCAGGPSPGPGGSAITCTA